MVILGRLLLFAALAAAIASIWIQPYWPQLLGTAAMLFIPGLVLISAAQNRAR